jgi:hypothetical protein
MGKSKKKQDTDTRSLVDLVFSWSIRDVLDENFYRNQVCLRLIISFMSLLQALLLAQKRESISVCYFFVV